MTFFFNRLDSLLPHLTLSGSHSSFSPDFQLYSGMAVLLFCCTEDILGLLTAIIRGGSLYFSLVSGITDLLSRVTFSFRESTSARSFL